jgi:hypothetical protein
MYADGINILVGVVENPPVPLLKRGDSNPF